MKNSKTFTKLSYRKKQMVKNFITIILAVLVVVFVPFLAIWGLNTLFPVLAIPYNVETWAAIIIVAGTFTSTRYIVRK